MNTTISLSPRPEFSSRAAWLLLTVLTLLPLPGFPLPEDKQQPIHIASDTAERDDKAGITRYLGNVNISQGSMKIVAQEVTIYNNDKGVTRIAATGQPASFEQQPKAEDKPVIASARQIVYRMETNRVELLGDASIVQSGTTVSSQRIEYFVDQERVTASGGGADAPSSQHSVPQRVEVIIPPMQ